MATLRNLVETALSEYLGGQIDGTDNVYPGFATGDKVAPCVICRAVSAEEEHLNSGVYRVTCRIETHAMAANGETAFDALCAEVQTALSASNLNVLLQNAATGLTVWGTAMDGRLSWDTQDDAWIEAIEIQLVCAATTFPA